MKRLCTATVFVGMLLGVMGVVVGLFLIATHIAPDMWILAPDGWLKWPWVAVSFFAWGFCLHRLWGCAKDICTAIRNWADRQAGGL